jgi:hypothetical protein
MSRRRRHTPEQIVRKLREGERMLNDGKDLTEVLRQVGGDGAPCQGSGTDGPGLVVVDSTVRLWSHDCIDGS